MRKKLIIALLFSCVVSSGFTQVHPVFVFDPYDCPNCTVLFRLIDKELQEDELEVFLTQDFKSPEDEAILKQKYRFLKTASLYSWSECYFRDSIETPKEALLGIVMDRHLVWKRPVKHIQSIDIFFDLLARTQGRKVIELKEPLSSSIKFYPLQDEQLLIQDNLAQRLYRAHLDSTELYPFSIPSVRELYLKTNQKEAYRIYEQGISFMQTYGLDSLVLEDALFEDSVLYLSFAIPWIYKQDSTTRFNYRQVLLHKDYSTNEKDYITLQTSSLSHEKYYAEFSVPHLINGNQYLLAVFNEGALVQPGIPSSTTAIDKDDAWLAWYERRGRDLVFNRLVDFPYPEGFTNFQHRSVSASFKASKRYLAFDFYPCVVNLKEKAYVYLELPQNEWNEKGLPKQPIQYALLAFQASSDGWDLLVNLGAEEGFYWMTFDTTGQVQKRTRILAPKISAACFIDNKLVLREEGNALTVYDLESL